MLPIERTAKSIGSFFERAERRGELQAWWPSDPEVRAVRRAGLQVLDKHGSALVQTTLKLVLLGVAVKLLAVPGRRLDSQAQGILLDALHDLVLQLFLAPLMLGLIQMYVMASVTLLMRSHRPGM